MTNWRRKRALGNFRALLIIVAEIAAATGFLGIIVSVLYNVYRFSSKGINFLYVATVNDLIISGFFAFPIVFIVSVMFWLGWVASGATKSFSDYLGLQDNVVQSVFVFISVVTLWAMDNLALYRTWHWIYPCVVGFGMRPAVGLRDSGKHGIYIMTFFLILLSLSLLLASATTAKYIDHYMDANLIVRDGPIKGCRDLRAVWIGEQSAVVKCREPKAGYYAIIKRENLTFFTPS